MELIAAADKYLEQHKFQDAVSKYTEAIDKILCLDSQSVQEDNWKSIVSQVLNNRGQCYYLQASTICELVIILSHKLVYYNYLNGSRISIIITLIVNNIYGFRYSF